MLKHERLLSQQKSAKNGQNPWREPLMGNKLSNLGHYRTLSPGLGPELPITAEVSVVASWGGGTVDQRTRLRWYYREQETIRAPARDLPGSNNPDMASHHIAAGGPSPNCARDNVIKLKKVIFQAWRQLQIFPGFDSLSRAGGWQWSKGSRVKLAPQCLLFNENSQNQRLPENLKRNPQKRTLSTVSHSLSDKSRGSLYFNLTDYSIIWVSPVFW